jgi:tetraacyldisaccharide 4'-kinase
MRALPPEIVRVTGNLKYDFAPSALPEDSPALRFADASGAPLLVAASTSADDEIEEEDGLLEAFKDLPGWRLLIAPRKPERFDAVARKLADSGFNWTRRSAMTHESAEVLLLDSIGELSGLFAHASVVFMGGTVANKGGHNILEPALYGKPVIAGPHLENFRDIEHHFEKHRALLRIGSFSELPEAVKSAGRSLGERALCAANMKRGAAKRTADEVTAIYESSYPRELTSQPLYGFLWCLALIWRMASAWDRKHKTARARALPAPVVSVGNITAGGTGKTPVTIELLRDFMDCRPALLTRGHGRDTGEIVLLKKGDEQLPIALTGDEAQLYVRSTHVPIGIGADRYEAGSRLIEAVPDISVFFLDDGFQHLQLKRDFDLVLIDAIHPFGGGDLLPLGRLREPLAGLARADAVVLTRSDEALNLSAIEHEIRRWNASAPIYRARVVARRWTNANNETIAVSELKGLRSLAFCGLGNPRTFWRSLDQVGVDTVERIDFGDHHRYNPREFQRLVRHAKDVGVDALVTTAKDAVNLCPEFGRMMAPLRLFWLDIGVCIDGHDELIGLIGKRVALKSF